MYHSVLPLLAVTMNMIVKFEELPMFPVEDYMAMLTLSMVVDPISPDDFWMVPLTTTPLLHQMQNCMDNLYRTFVEDVESDDPEIREMKDLLTEIQDSIEERMDIAVIVSYVKNYFGDYGVTYIDGKLYRVLINYWNVEDGSVGVFMIDAGKSSRVMVGDVVPLSRRLAHYPWFSVHCCLDGISPPNGTSEWPEASITLFKNMIQADNVWVAYFSTCDEQNLRPKKYPVHLNWPGDGNRSVMDLLVSYRAALLELESDALEEDELASWNPLEADFESHRNQYNVDVDDPGVALFGYAGQDEEVICHHFARRGFCYKGDTCRKEHIDVNPDKFTNVPQLFYNRAFEELDPLTVDEEYDLLGISLSKGELYVILSQDEHFYGSVEVLEKKLNSKGVLDKLQPLQVPAAVGELVLVESEGHWVRGQCLMSEPEVDEFTILLVDQGYTITVEHRKLRIMTAAFLHVPFLARPVRIKDLKLTCVEERESDFVILLGQLPHLIMKVVGTDDSHVVELFTEDGKRLEPLLLQWGLATRCESLLVDPCSLYRPG